MDMEAEKQTNKQTDPKLRGMKLNVLFFIWTDVTEFHFGEVLSSRKALDVAFQDLSRFKVSFLPGFLLSFDYS